MKIRNKKTGEIFSWREDLMPFGLGYPHPKSLAELNEEWEDYKPIEPLIKDELVREIIKKWYNKNKIVGKLRSYGNESWLGLRGTDEDECYWKIELHVSYISLLKYEELYSLDELIGEEE